MDNSFSPELMLLDDLICHGAAYRRVLGRIFVLRLRRPRDGRRYFFGLLLAVSRLYNDYLLIHRAMPKLLSISRSFPATVPSEVDVNRQRRLRERLKHRLAALPCWCFFGPDMAFCTITRLKSLGDYLDSFALHLPEIHEETLRLEACSLIFRQQCDRQALACLKVGLQHMGQHHISFVRFALEGAADESSWS